MQSKKPTKLNEWIKKPAVYLAGVFFTSLIGALIGSYIGSNKISTYLPWEHPIMPSVGASTYSNASINGGSVATISITNTPDYVPPFSVDVSKPIQNEDNNACDEVLNVQTSKGFQFLPVDISDLPSNISIDPGYIDHDTMTISITNFPGRDHYVLTFPICTNDITLKNSGDITITPLHVSYTH